MYIYCWTPDDKNWCTYVKWSDSQTTLQTNDSIYIKRQPRYTLSPDRVKQSVSLLITLVFIKLSLRKSQFLKISRSAQFSKDMTILASRYWLPDYMKDYEIPLKGYCKLACIAKKKSTLWSYTLSEKQAFNEIIWCRNLAVPVTWLQEEPSRTGQIILCD